MPAYLLGSRLDLRALCNEDKLRTLPAAEAQRCVEIRAEVLRQAPAARLGAQGVEEAVWRKDVIH